MGYSGIVWFIGSFISDLAPHLVLIIILQVENSVVGAPCGVMDQMASACGEANKLLAMVCQVYFPILPLIMRWRTGEVHYVLYYQG